ncbi:MAG: hypothetical protein M0T85_16665 [Dehalococcoidales bacterium]|nr:hypothetical protein [Dehalococcoidales bacterium]
MANYLDRDPETGKFISSAVATNPLPNPTLLGEDLESMAWRAVGVGVSAFASDNILSPIAQKIIPGATNGMEAKLVDAGATMASGYVTGELVGMVSQKVGRHIRYGGILLGVAKVISAFIPGFSISAKIPVPPGFPSLTAPQQAAKEIAAPAAGSVASKYFSTYPRPVGADQAVGL